MEVSVSTYRKRMCIVGVKLGGADLTAGLPLNVLC